MILQINVSSSLSECALTKVGSQEFAHQIRESDTVCQALEMNTCMDCLKVRLTVKLTVSNEC